MEEQEKVISGKNFTSIEKKNKGKREKNYLTKNVWQVSSTEKICTWRHFKESKTFLNEWGNV